MKKTLFFLIISLFSITFILAQPTQTHLNIQTTDDSGNIITGTFVFNFSISTTNNCNNIIYSKLATLKTDNRGIISYYLTDTNTINFNQELYLCYYRDSVLKNVSYIGGIPYAYFAKNSSNSNNSQYLQGYTPSDFWQVSNSQTGLTGNKEGSFNINTTGDVLIGAVDDGISKLQVDGQTNSNVYYSNGGTQIDISGWTNPSDYNHAVLGNIIGSGGWAGNGFGFTNQNAGSKVFGLIYNVDTAWFGSASDGVTWFTASNDWTYSGYAQGTLAANELIANSHALIGGGSSPSNVPAWDTITSLQVVGGITDKHPFFGLDAKMHLKQVTDGSAFFSYNVIDTNLVDDASTPSWAMVMGGTSFDPSWYMIQTQPTGTGWSNPYTPFAVNENGKVIMQGLNSAFPPTDDGISMVQIYGDYSGITNTLYVDGTSSTNAIYATGKSLFTEGTTTTQLNNGINGVYASYGSYNAYLANPNSAGFFNGGAGGSVTLSGDTYAVEGNGVSYFTDNTNSITLNDGTYAINATGDVFINGDIWLGGGNAILDSNGIDSIDINSRILYDSNAYPVLTFTSDGVSSVQITKANSDTNALLVNGGLRVIGNVNITGNVTAGNICYSNGSNCVSSSINYTNIALTNQSNTFQGNQIINGNLNVTGNVTADKIKPNTIIMNEVSGACDLTINHSICSNETGTFIVG